MPNATATATTTATISRLIIKAAQYTTESCLCQYHASGEETLSATVTLSSPLHTIIYFGTDETLALALDAMLE
jgi:hypothetical protein